MSTLKDQILIKPVAGGEDPFSVAVYRDRYRAPAIEVTGQVDLTTLFHLRESLFQLIDEGHPHVIVDLTHVSYLDSRGIGVLVAAFKRLRERDGALWMVSPPNHVTHRVLTITGLGKLLGLYPSIQDAANAIPTR